MWGSNNVRDGKMILFLRFLWIIQVRYVLSVILLKYKLLSPSKESDSVAEKLLSYNRANRAVAVLCNHQRAPPKTFEQSMANLQVKVRTTWLDIWDSVLNHINTYVTVH